MVKTMCNHIVTHQKQCVTFIHSLNKYYLETAMCKVLWLALGIYHAEQVIHKSCPQNASEPVRNFKMHISSYSVSSLVIHKNISIASLLTGLTAGPVDAAIHIHLFPATSWLELRFFHIEHYQLMQQLKLDLSRKLSALILLLDPLKVPSSCGFLNPLKVQKHLCFRIFQQCLVSNFCNSQLVFSQHLWQLKNNEVFHTNCLEMHLKFNIQAGRLCLP